MKDRFIVYSNAAAITPSDSAIITPTPFELWISTGAGATGIKVDTLGGQTVTFPLAASLVSRLPVMVTRIYATGTALGTGGAVFGLW